MAFIVLRRSRNTQSYYLVESYRDNSGRARKRTLCYLGRAQDGTDTLAKAIAHWQEERDRLRRSLKSAPAKRKDALRKRRDAASARIELLRFHIAQEERVLAARKERERLAEETLLWRAFERLRRQPGEETERAAKKAFLTLAKRYHPDQGGSHAAFLRLKETYDRALAASKRAA